MHQIIVMEPLSGYPSRFNPKRPIKPEDLPEIDAVLISRDHYDHLDRETILTIHERVKHFYVPLGVAPI